MSWHEWLVNLMIPLGIWLLYVWLITPKYEDGRYVPLSERVRSASRRVFCHRNKSRADDP